MPKLKIAIAALGASTFMTGAFVALSASTAYATPGNSYVTNHDGHGWGWGKRRHKTRVHVKVRNRNRNDNDVQRVGPSEDRLAEQLRACLLLPPGQIRGCIANLTP